MHEDMLTKTAKCNPCAKICRNLEPVIPSSKRMPLRLCKVSNIELQVDFGGPIFNEKTQEVYFSIYIRQFSKYPMAGVFKNANADNLHHFLEVIPSHDVTSPKRTNRAGFQICQQITTVCMNNKTEVIGAPVYDHGAME